MEHVQSATSWSNKVQVPLLVSEVLPRLASSRCPWWCQAQANLPLLFFSLPERGNLAGVRHVVLVLSGKGGVGKSTISTELALALRHAGKKVRILFHVFLFHILPL